MERAPGFLARLAGDRTGSTLAMVAAAILPLLALVGGGVDISRGYLAQARLQQACDAGVLAARKRLGSQAATTGIIPGDVAGTGQRFFDVNFADGAYGTTGRSFSMTLENDYSIGGAAAVTVPTTIMRVFGDTSVAVNVTCDARLNFSNTDVMMVLDTTGSMAETLPGDSQSKISALRQVVKTFYSQLEASKASGTRVRFGFVPYSVNVNVGGLLKSDWLVDRWTYQGRQAETTGLTVLQPTYSYDTTSISGSYAIDALYKETYCPADTATTTLVSHTTASGTETWRYMIDGTRYACAQSNPTSYDVTPTSYYSYVYDYTKKQTGTIIAPTYAWKYQPMPFDVSFLKGAAGTDPPRLGKFTVKMNGTPDAPTDMDANFRGCIEERATYPIDDYDNVDFSRALDLDLDTVPTPGNPATQWRPIFGEISFLRSLDWFGGGSFTPSAVSSDQDFANAYLGGYSVCPAPARKLSEITPADLNAYVDGLTPAGNTYHDIGMLWGGRLLSPTGIFADENADLPGHPTSRHLIFLTDGETAPRDVTYGAYGIEPLDQRRWSSGSSQTLTQVVESRFTLACKEVKKRNITVWVVGFGTEMTGMLKNCAGDGHWFQANDAGELNKVFGTIANAMGDLRIAR